jgi:hypothetical protein
MGFPPLSNGSRRLEPEKSYEWQNPGAAKCIAPEGGNAFRSSRCVQRVARGLCSAGASRNDQIAICSGENRGATLRCFAHRFEKDARIAICAVYSTDKIAVVKFAVSLLLLAARMPAAFMQS